MSLDEGAVRQALSTLDEKGLASTSRNRDSRVVKFEHHMQEVFNFRRDETAIICELLLRGPQTPGELRGRAERMYAFEDLSAVQSTLQRLAQHDPPLVKMLPKQAGMKESRFAHLLSGDVEGWQPEPSPEPHRQVVSHDAERIAQLEAQLATLQTEVAELRQRVDILARFRGAQHQDTPSGA
jgi:uncharacterized protein